MRITLGSAVAGSVAAGLGLVALLGPVLAPHDPRAVVGPSLAAPSGAYLLGTNDTGQDVLSQLLVGAGVTLTTGLLAAALAVGLGVAVGATAGMLRGWPDLIAMRSVDVLLAIPALPLMILVAALTGPSRPVIILLIGLAGWPPIARVIRSQTLTIATRGFVVAARGFGASRTQLLGRHLVPGLAPLIVATFIDWTAAAIALEAGLGFLGLGDPTDVSWGSMLQRALEYDGIYFTSAWTWWVLPAGLAVTLSALALGFAGVAVEPRTNPRWRRG